MIANSVHYRGPRIDSLAFPEITTINGLFLGNTVSNDTLLVLSVTLDMEHFPFFSGWKYKWIAKLLCLTFVIFFPHNISMLQNIAGVFSGFGWKTSIQFFHSFFITKNCPHFFYGVFDAHTNISVHSIPNENWTASEWKIDK